MAKNEKEIDEKMELFDLDGEKERSRKVMSRFEKAKNFNSGRFDSYTELMAFYQGNQHLLKNYKTKQPWVINMNTPYASVAVDNRISSLLASDYMGDLLPLAPEDVETIDALEKLYRKEWERINIDECVRSAIRTSGIVREGYIHLFLNLNKTVGGSKSQSKGALEAYNIEPSCVYIDPNARKLRDADYMFVADRISKAEACKKYPNKEELFKSGASLAPSERGEVYADNDYTTQQDVLTILTYYAKSSTGKIERSRLINGIFVEEKKEMELTRFPIYQMRWKKAAQSCYGLGLLDEVLSLQKAICSIESAITNTALAYAAPSMMVRKGCGIDPTVASISMGAPGVVYSVDGDLDNAMRPVIPPRIEDAILKIKLDYENKIDKITGNSNQFLGDLGTAGNTKGGANIAVDRAKIIEMGVLNNIREFVSDITEGLVEYLIYLYAGKDFMAYDGKKIDGTGHKFLKITVPDQKSLSNAQYNYHIELETKTPYSKEKQKELLLEIYQLERQYDTPIKTVTVGDIIKTTDLVNRDEITARFNNLTRQDASTKADVISKLTVTARSQGISEELLSASITDIIGGEKETPSLDELMTQMENNFQKEIQNNDQNMSNAVDTLMTTPQSINEVQQMTQQQELPQ